MRKIEAQPIDARRSDWAMAEFLGSRWPRSFRLAQDLMVAVEKSMKGRQGFFSKKPTEGEVERILRDFGRSLAAEGFGTGEPWFPSDDAELVFRFLSMFSVGFPNWQAEYGFLNGTIPKVLTGGRPSSVQADVAVSALEKLRLFVTDDAFQNTLLPDAIRDRILYGSAIDMLPEGTGPFGKTASNPIPVNGPLGEITYLSRLRTPNGQRILAHRIGAVGNVDVYETVSFDGKIWDQLYLDLYHPRKSRRVPAEYNLVSQPSEFDLLTAVNFEVADFPAGMPDALRKCASDYGAPAWMSSSDVYALLKRVAFLRPVRPSSSAPAASAHDNDRTGIASPDIEQAETLPVAVFKWAEDICGDIHSMIETGDERIHVPMEKVFATALRTTLAGAIVAARRAGLPEGAEEQFANGLEAAVSVLVLNPEGNAELVSLGFIDFSHEERHSINQQLYWGSMEAEAFFREDACRSDDRGTLSVRLDGRAVVDHVGSMFPLPAGDRARLMQMSLAFRTLSDLQYACDSFRSILLEGTGNEIR